MGNARGIYNYDGEEFEVTRTSPDSITISLNCEDHDHDEYIVGRIEGHKGWGLGTKASGGYAHDGDTFVDAVNHCASLLAVKCVDLRAIAEVDEFFAAAVKPALTDRLDALAEFLPKFESPDFEFGRMESPPGAMPFYVLSDTASKFHKTCYQMKWVQPFDWSKWKDSPEAIKLRDEPSALEQATPEQLERLLTVLIRQDRFVEGALGGAYESGLLTRIIRRAAALVEEYELEGIEELDVLDLLEEQAE